MFNVQWSTGQLNVQSWLADARLAAPEKDECTAHHDFYKTVQVQHNRAVINRQVDGGMEEEDREMVEFGYKKKGFIRKRPTSHLSCF